LREESARRAEAEGARQQAEDAIRNQTMGSQPSLGRRSRALNLVELTRSPRLLADHQSTLTV
jgi:hypothetical protein